MVAAGEGALYGIFGGVCAEFLSIFALRHVPKELRPEWLKSWFFWILTVVRVLLGGAIVVVYLKSGFQLNPLLSLHIGASLPLIIRALAEQTPPLGPGKVG